MATIYHPNIKHSWYYNGPMPTKEEYRIALNYLQTKKKLNLHERITKTP